jgi:hypothetical protein
MSRRDELKGKRERRYGLGDLPDISRADRGEIPRPAIGNLAPAGPGTSTGYDPSQGLPTQAGPGLAGPNVPKPSLAVTSTYNGMPVRATKFVAFLTLTLRVVV